MRRAIQSYARLLLVLIVALGVYGFFVLPAEAGRYCFSGRCYNTLFVNEFDKIQDVYKSQSLSKLCWQGRGCVERWPKGTFRKTPDTHGICVGNNCVTEGAPIIKNVDVSIKGARGGQRYKGDYIVEGEVVSQPYYRAGAVFKYSNEFKKWISANENIRWNTATETLEEYYKKLTKSTGAFSDAKHPFDMYFRAHTEELVDPALDRSLDYMKNSPLTDLSTFTCHNVSGRREFVYNDIYRAVTFSGGGTGKSYEEELLCKIRYKNTIGLEAVEKFKVGKFQPYPPEAYINKNVYFADGMTKIDIMTYVSNTAGSNITESYIEAIHCGAFRYTEPPQQPRQENWTTTTTTRYNKINGLWYAVMGWGEETTERLNNDGSSALGLPYPLCDTTFRLIVKSTQGDVSAEVMAITNKYGSWKEGRRYARTMKDYLTQIGLTQQELQDRATMLREKGYRAVTPQDSDRSRVNWENYPPKQQYKFPDPLPPCSDKPPVSGGIWKLSDQDYGDLNLYWPVYTCDGKEITCYDVLPRCFDVDLQSSKKPTSCDQGTGLFGLGVKEYSPNNDPWYAILLESISRGLFGSSRNVEHVREKYRVVKCQDHIIDSPEDYEYSDELRLGNWKRGNDWARAKEKGFPVDFNGESIPYRQPPPVSRPPGAPAEEDPKTVPPPIQPVYQGSCGATADRDCNTIYVNKPSDPPPPPRNTSVGHAEVGQGRAEKTKSGQPIPDGIDANEYQTRLTELRIKHEGFNVVGTNAEDGKPVLRPLNPVTTEEVDNAMRLTPEERKEKLKNVGKGDATQIDRTIASLGGEPAILKTKFNSPCNTSFPSNILHVCYFDNRNAALSAEKSIFQTDEFKITESLRSGNVLYNKWGEGFISMTGKSDNISAVWRGNLLYEGGDYTFVITSDDGVELEVDGKKIIRDWSSHAEKEYSRRLSLTKGYHKIQLRWYEHGGAATLIFGWRKE